MRALLAAAVQHHQAGNLKRARALYEQLLAADPTHADALQYYGILCDQCGDAPRAESLIRRAIAVRDDVAPYHDNLGTVLEHRGQLDAALSAYEEAERLEPGIAERAYNVGLVLERLGHSAQAERRYRAALEHHPGNIDCRFGLANLLSARGDLQAATEAYRQLLSIDEGHAAARVNLGNALQDDGQIAQALGEYRLVIARAPDNVMAYHNQGRALLRVERLAEAQHSFEQALRLDSQLVEARLGLAQSLERQGFLDRAYAAFRAVCAGAAASEKASEQARAGLLRVARVLPPPQHDELLVAVLLSAIDAGEACASSYARVLGVQLAAKAGLHDAACEDEADALHRAITLERDPLFEVALQRCVNVVPKVERWLCAVRRALLHASAGDLSGREPLLRALALQCAANEYVFAVTDAEVGVIDAVLAQIESQAPADLLDAEDTVRDVLLCACYGPLSELGGVISPAAPAGVDNPWLAPILERSLLEPLREQAIAAGIETLAAIDEASSQLVRTQYEENPYPRWREMETVLPVTDAADRDPIARALADTAGASVLVAGCGTGHEPLMLARRYPGYPVLAMDLSRASLAYAARMAEELQIGSVSFMHGDLLDVQRLRRKFQVITASGVLHHLADPLAGWRALTHCLDAPGVMKVALYSRRARATVNAARERVAALGLPASAQGVRALRARVLAGHEPALESLLDSEDFYTTSMCRDLIFHPLEHQFDLHEVAAMLASLDLQFAGFELAHPLIRRQFLAARLGEETDLAAWDRFEESNPQTFEGMYVMWCRKKNPAHRGDEVAQRDQG